MSGKEGNIHHLDLYVSDLERSAEFWGWFLGELGYRPYGQSKTGRSWSNEETTVFLVQVEPDYLEPGYHRKRAGLNHLAFSLPSTERVDSLCEKLKAKGIPVLYGGPRRSARDYALFFEDPDRIKIEAVCPIERPPAA